MYVHNKRRRKKIRAFVFWLKSRLRCHDCGGTFHPTCLQFDHDRGKKKSAAVANYIGTGGTVKGTLEEIVKCTPRCANCHHLRTLAPEIHRKRRGKKHSRPYVIRNITNLWNAYYRWERREWEQAP